MGRVKTIWITRTEPSAANSARAWQSAGFDPIIAPLLTISAPPETPAPPPPDAVLVFTSPNGVFAYQSYQCSRDHTVITVGDKTADAARAAGFVDVRSAQGQSEDVTQLIQDSISKNKLIVHCAGRHVRGAIVEDLQAAGYTAKRDLYYQSAPVNSLPNIDLASVTHVALYSPLGAKTLAAVVPDTAHMHAVSLSPAIDAALGAQTFAKRCISPEPNEAAMIALLLPRTAR